MDANFLLYKNRTICHSIVAMCTVLLRNLVWTAPRVVAYLVLAPSAAQKADRWLELTWPLPAWTAPLALVLISLGSACALWCVWSFATTGQGTPNPLSPPKHLVVRGPYRISRNPIMLGGWMAGLGLAVILRSISLLTVYLITICAGVLYVRLVEEPELTRRFGESYRAYTRSVPRWIGCCLLLLCMFMMPLPAASAPSEPVPSVIVLIKCKPGTTSQWKGAFEKQIAPAIREAIEKGDEITGFQYFEKVVAGEPYDFVLIMHAQTFAFFDRPRFYPHYQALFRRLGKEQTERLLAEMESWEAMVTVTLVRGYGLPK